MQIQFFPLLVEPIINLIAMMPKDHVYFLNLDVQKNALKLLKEITRSNTFDDTNQLQLLIGRLKCEFTILAAS